MILVLKQGTTKDKVDEICKWLNDSYGVQTSPVFGSGTTIIGLVGDTSSIELEAVEMHDAVDRAMRVQEPYKRANRKFHPDDTVIQVGDVSIGGKKICIAAGPCSVESEDQIKMVADMVRDGGAAMLRGGAFKPRTSPYAFQGLKAEGLMYMKRARQSSGLPVVSEITNPAQLELFMEFVDVIQVGTRNMQNFELLKELGRVRKPVLLKRGFANTIDELLMSAEYIMSGGNQDVILCERGIRTFETSTRNTLDISAVPVLKSRTHLPVFVDPSHAAGMAWLVEPLAKAAVVAGADGLIIEVHNDPRHALSDGQQSLTPEDFNALVQKLKPLAEAVGRSI
ncbi:MAG: 3-deoxy-7-phosphoheptulonate synthase [Eubacteriales bacterium]|nr:3-deoxy-7-phosphoheptulonate synthase [Eubacteriales bacterium]MDD3196868.1 3-deoxy-7-phosphoheptulonate synthase [Eubacteriales bacterium]MDD3502773.1 3-deoxy-7-phosphoheptulonate synthase [Eubacteriales bacterium]MDD4682517.1 3-deoxy-7-phosphoheptulonate synthase [Eubacteriales bacterium]